MSKGIFAYGYGLGIQPHANTWRVLIVGPSNSGKTTLFGNIIPMFPRPIKSITYIAPLSSQKDEAPQKLKEICKKVGIKWNGVDPEKLAMPDTEKPEIVVFDDLFKVKKVEPLVDEFAIRGRHEGRHVVYMTQSPAYVPNSIKVNSNYVILHKDFFNEDSFHKLHLEEPYARDVDPSADFHIFKAGKYLQPYRTPTYKNSGNVLKVFKSIHGGKSKGTYVRVKEDASTTEVVKKGIESAGNQDISNADIYTKKPLNNNLSHNTFGKLSNKKNRFNI